MFSVTTQNEFDSNQRPPLHNNAVDESHFNLASAVSESEQSVITAAPITCTPIEQSTARRSVPAHIIDDGDKCRGERHCKSLVSFDYSMLSAAAERQPLCQLNIQLSANGAWDSVVVYSGESPRSLAASFAQKHSLSMVVEKVLTE